METPTIISSLSEISEMPPVSAALGYFDGLHLGHAEVIRASVLNKELLKSAVLTFNNSNSLPKLAKSGNILSNGLKISLLEKMGVDYIISLDFNEVKDLTPERFVTEVLQDKINAQSVNCGTDYTFGKNRAGDVHTLKALCHENNIAVNVVQKVELSGKTISSTYIRRLISEGSIAEANRFLGYDFMFEEEVVRGAMLGRTLGTPTINQVIREGNIIPRFGVYKSYTELCGVRYVSLTNIGIKPTVSDNPVPLAETYIVGYAGDLYGKTVRVSLVDYIRNEMKFNNIYELKAQIEKDKQYLQEG